MHMCVYRCIVIYIDFIMYLRKLMSDFYIIVKLGNHCQWRIQRVLDAGILVWASKLCAQIIEKCLK